MTCATALFVVNLVCAGAVVMQDNQGLVNEAHTSAGRFEETRGSEWLERAYMALENVSLTNEPDAAARLQMRSRTLDAWLQLLELLDRSLDPAFNPDNVPELLVQPPATSDGGTLRAGVDPAKITDPKARAEYEKARAANDARTVQYGLQIKLRRLDERIEPRAEAFIRRSYTSSSRDLEELKRMIDATIKAPQRKARLSAVLAEIKGS